MTALPARLHATITVTLEADDVAPDEGGGVVIEDPSGTPVEGEAGQVGSIPEGTADGVVFGGLVLPVAAEVVVDICPAEGQSAADAIAEACQQIADRVAAGPIRAGFGAEPGSSV